MKRTYRKFLASNIISLIISRNFVTKSLICGIMILGAAACTSSRQNQLLKWKALKVKGLFQRGLACTGNLQLNVGAEANFASYPIRLHGVMLN
jgi:hypothetical protein